MINFDLKFITRTGLLLALALIIQSIHLPQFLTGSVVNAVLLVAAIYINVLAGVIIGCITPLAALSLGIISPVLAPFVPVIAVANAALVILFHFLAKVHRYLAWVGAAAGKFCVFYLAIHYLLKYLNIQLPPPALVAFQIPQLYTALTGGFAAIVIARYLDRAFKSLDSKSADL